MSFKFKFIIEVALVGFDILHVVGGITINRQAGKQTIEPMVYLKGGD